MCNCMHPLPVTQNLERPNTISGGRVGGGEERVCPGVHCMGALYGAFQWGAGGCVYSLEPPTLIRWTDKLCRGGFFGYRWAIATHPKRIGDRTHLAGEMNTPRPPL